MVREEANTRDKKKPIDENSEEPIKAQKCGH
jgi:hypothetical protein